MKSVNELLTPTEQALVVAMVSAVVRALRERSELITPISTDRPVPPADNQNLLLRPGEAAAALGVSRAKVYELIASGTIPSIRIGSSIRVPLEALRKWIASETVAQGE